MKRLNNPAGTNPGCTRREALGLLGGSARAARRRRGVAIGVRAGSDDVLTEALVLRDPDVPADRQSRRRHQHRRMVRLQLPVLPQDRARDQPGGAGRRQGPPGAEGLADPRRGLEIRRRGWRWRRSIRTSTWPAHEAMIGVSSKLTEPRIRELLAGAGIDMDRLNRDRRDQCQGDRHHPRPQPRSGGGVRIQGNAVLHRRQVPRAGNPDHGGIRDGDRRRAQGQSEQLGELSGQANGSRRAALPRSSP